MTDAALIEYLPDPLLLLFSSGQTERANRAARDLATKHALRPDLIAMFGKDAAVVLARAKVEGAAHGFMSLRTVLVPAPIYRVAIRRVATSERFTVGLVDLSREFSWRGQLAARNREIAVLNDIAAALSSTLDLSALAERIYEQASRIMNAVNFYIALHDLEAGTLSFPIRVENRERLPAMPARPFANGLTEHVLRTRQPLLLNGDVLAQAFELGLAPIGRPARSWLGVPLLADGEAIGVIVLQDHEGTGSYDQHDMDVLTLVAGQASAAVRNARLLARAGEAYRELSETQTTLLEAERLRGITETVGALNHEVNNPLAAISGSAQLLLKDPGSLGPGAEGKVRRILEAARRIQSVTSRMANLIHATSTPYPGNEAILDVSRSRAREDSSHEPALDSGGSPPVPGAEREPDPR